jgi:rhodanese-related sulfurtransferase
MTPPAVAPLHIRRALLLREEIALLDLRHEAAYATGHPLFAANMAAGRIELEAEIRLPRKDVPIVVYDAGEGLVAQAADRLTALGYTDVRQLSGGLQAWQTAGYELFRDVNSYAKAFGELVESRRHTPSLPADDVAALIAAEANIAILDVRRPDEYATMNIPGSVSVPGAELVLRAGGVAPDPETTIIVNCAGRTRSIIGTQSLINAGVANKVLALRNGTIGWTLATSPIAPASGTSASKTRWRCRPTRAARCIASTFAPRTIMRPATSQASAIIREASWSRRSTWPHRCAARASC